MMRAVKINNFFPKFAKNRAKSARFNGVGVILPNNFIYINMHLYSIFMYSNVTLSYLNIRISP